MAELITEAREKGIQFKWNDLYLLNTKMGRRGALIVPPYVTEFISAYVDAKKPQSVLDPWAGIGSLLQPVVDKNAIPEATGISPMEADIKVAKLMDVRSSVEWILKKPEESLKEVNKFDLVVSSPPIGLPPTAETFDTSAGTIEVRESRTNVLVLESALHLSKDGEGVYILPNSFFFAKSSALVRDTLPKLGLHVNSIITLPPGEFAFTSIELNVVFISRKQSTDVFVGRLSPDRDPSALVNNLQKRKPGPVPELGRLVELQEYRGWHALIAQDEQQRLAERSGLEPIELTELVEEVNLGKRSEDGGFDDLPNCVYLPLIGTSPAVTALSDLKIKPQNYAQLIVRPDKAYAEFLAEFFNSPLGRKTRDALLRGTYIPKINKSSLLEATVFTLPVEAQKKAVAVGQEIKELRLRLEQAERELWNRPVDAEKVGKVIETLNRKESLEAWLETLPFPLASILWRYQATRNIEHKNAHLLNFFEATAQFMGTLMTSAFHSSAQFFLEHKRNWFESGDGPHSLARSSFGEWVVRCQRLARTTRQLLSRKKQRDLCLDLYRTNDSNKVETIANKSLFQILEKVSRYRNDWKGHTGIISRREYERRFTILQEELNRLRGLLGTVFEDWWLLRPGANEYTAGIYHYRGKKLMGSRQIFKEVTLQTPTPMDREELYFFDTTTRQPLQILHFFRMMRTPETEEIACYFYNRLEKDGVRWVSYHFEGQAERIEPDDSVLKLIDEVEHNNE
ncbi:N-6 DNA methylase [Acidobacteria bacterium AH-259-L09]|nr:N-6 DNA methylase [Acidobacteria bacterium AH-259-L09]